MNEKYFYICIFLLALGTYSIRFSFVGFSKKISLNDQFKKILSYIPAAVLPAMITPMVFFHKGEVANLAGKERFVALVFASVLCFFWRNMLVSLVSGLGLLYILTQL
ncbi:MAG: AzlD domain-containing protein [Bdellovibrionota bacterium]|nr:AzlD domain-containing protein [Bdellovibrionota bacterium]